MSYLHSLDLVHGDLIGGWLCSWPAMLPALRPFCGVWEVRHQRQAQAACWLLLVSAACCPMHQQLAVRHPPCHHAGNNILLCTSTKDARGFTVKVGAVCTLELGCWLLRTLLRVSELRLSSSPSPASPEVADCRFWPLQDTHKIAADAVIWDSHTYASW